MTEMDDLRAQVAVLEAGLRRANDALDLAWQYAVVGPHCQDRTDTMGAIAAALDEARALLGGVPVAAPEPLTAAELDTVRKSLRTGQRQHPQVAACPTCGSTDHAVRYDPTNNQHWYFPCQNAWHSGEGTT